MAAARRPRARRPRTARARPPRRDGERKRDATRRLVLERALELFQREGVDGTTMRDIARAAGLSLGAAYYYFPSKEALVFAFYEEHHDDFEALAAQGEGSLRERLGALFHGKLRAIAPHRAMLASILGHLVDPADPLSAFSSETRAMRERAIGVMAAMLAGSGLPRDTGAVAAHALWLLHLASMLVFLHDRSPDGARTHGLVDEGLDLVVPMLPLLGTPAGRAVCERVSRALARAGIALAMPVE